MESNVTCAIIRIAPGILYILDFTNKAYDPVVRNQIFFCIVNGNGTRATARILGIAKDTVTDALRSIEQNLWFVNYDYINIEAEIAPVEEAEMDEMWSFVPDKSHQCWLWWAIDHNTGDPLAFCFGTREHKNLDALLRLLSPFRIKVVYADDNYAYKSRLTHSDLITGKRPYFLIRQRQSNISGAGRASAKKRAKGNEPASVLERLI